MSGELPEAREEAAPTPGQPGAETVAASAPAPARTPLERLRRGLRRHEEERGDAPEPPPAGIDTARYTVLGEVGRGGMGVVLEAEDALLRRRVALKVQRAGLTARAKARFLTEARLASQLEHPHIVPIYDLGGGEGDAPPWLSMRFVRGEPLRAVLARLRAGDPATAREWSQARLLEVLVAVVQAVAYAHSRGVIHRDLKPDNVMLGGFGEVFLMDFGLAKVVGPGDEASDPPAGAEPEPVRGQEEGVSRAGEVLGTPAYMAPEQARGEPADERSDVYGLGGLLYELLTLLAPVAGETTKELLVRVAEGVVPPRRRAPERPIPPELEAIALRCLALDPARRYARADELLADLRAWQDGRPVSVWRDPPWVRLAKLIRRHRTASAALGAALAVTLAAGGAFGAYRWRADARELLRVQELARTREAQLAQEQELARTREAQLAQEQELSRVKAADLERLERRQAATLPYLTGRDLLQRRLDRSTIAARAIPPLQEAVRLDPSFAEAHFALGQAWQRVGRWTDAVQEFVRALELQPGNAHWLVAMGDLVSQSSTTAHTAEEVRARAASYYQRAAARGPAVTPFARIGQAYLQLAERHFEEAQATATQARDEAPHLWEAWRCLGVVAMQRAEELGGNRWDAAQLEVARAAFARALELEPDQPWLLRGLASALKHLGRGEEALAALDRVVVLEPEEPTSYPPRGLLLMELGRLEEARRDLDRGLELDPRQGAGYENRGLLRKLIGDHRGAIADFTSAIAIEPDAVGAWAARGNLLSALGQSERAEGDLTRCVELAPHDALHWSNRSLARLRLGKLEEARADARHATELVPTFVGGWVHLGMIEEAAERPDAAEAAWTEGLARAGENAHLYMYRGQLRLHAEPPRAREAADDLGRAVMLPVTPPLPGAVWLLYAQALQGCDRPADALRALEEHRAAIPREYARELRHELGQCHAALARASAAAGAADEALAEWRRALETCPHAGDALAAAEHVLTQGDREAALELLERACELGLRDPAGLARRESLAPLRGDARFEALLARAPKRR